MFAGNFFDKCFLNIMSESERYYCQFSDCSNSYTSYNNLLHHYRVKPTHKPENLERRKRLSAKDVASGVLPSEIPSQTRSARLKELIKLFNDQEILEYAFPRVAQLIQPWQLILFASRKDDNAFDTRNILRLLNETIE